MTAIDGVSVIGLLASRDGAGEAVTCGHANLREIRQGIGQRLFLCRHGKDRVAVHGRMRGPNGAGEAVVDQRLQRGEPERLQHRTRFARVGTDVARSEIVLQRHVRPLR